MVLKKILKTILPRPVIDRAVDMRGQMRLSSVPPLPLEPANLRAANGFNLQALLNEPAIAAAWTEDHAAIARAIGDINLMGGVNPGDRRAIYTLVSALKPQKVLEVGTHIAASSLYIAAALKRESANHGILTTVDIIDVNHPQDAPWRRAGYAMPPADYARGLGFGDRVGFVQSPAVTFMENTRDRFDFIFLDGDHEPHSVYREVSAALKILNPGGVILLHDYYPGARPLWADGNIIGGPFRALSRIEKENAGITVQPLGSLPWPTKQGSSVTSLALVLKK